MNNDILNELKTNFIEYAVAVNTDRSVPNATDGLKPVAKRIIYGAYEKGFTSDKPHVKCANIVGNVMALWHPHGDSSIYGALTRLSQNWIMRYPLIDFHGSNGNIDGDGPAAYRYTEARTSKLAEDGMLCGIKKNNVDFIPNYSETEDEPVELPSIFPNLLCNPNSGIGVALASSWAPHNLNEVANAINQYIRGEEPTLPGPDFPTGGIVINKDDIPDIMRTGKGSVKIRGKYVIEGRNIVFTEIPYGVGTEAIMQQIGKACDEEKLTGIKEIRNESNKKGYRLVIECTKDAIIENVILKLFAETDLQTSFAYNQVALVNKVPTELNLKDCIKIYIDYNNKCIVRECMYDIDKATKRLHIIVGLLKALDIIDEIIAMIKASESAQTAKSSLIGKYGFSEDQAQAILDMKLSRLSHLEKVDLENEQKDLNSLLGKLNEICLNPTMELQGRLASIVAKYGDARRTELAQIEVVKPAKSKKEPVIIEPEKCVVVMTESGLIKRVPTAAFKIQNRNTKGVKTTNDIVSNIIRTNTVDNLFIFSDKGKVYKLSVGNIPEGTNVTSGVPIKSLVQMEQNEKATVIYSVYKDTDATSILFTTKQGLVKKTNLSDLLSVNRKAGISATKLHDGDELTNVNLIKDEDIILLTKSGIGIRISTADLNIQGRNAGGVKGINLAEGDEVIDTLVIRNENDNIALFSETGLATKMPMDSLNKQGRGGKGVKLYKSSPSTGNVIAGALLEDADNVLITGLTASVCVSAASIPLHAKGASGVQMIKGTRVTEISKI